MQRFRDLARLTRAGIALGIMLMLALVALPAMAQTSSGTSTSTPGVGVTATPGTNCLANQNIAIVLQLDNPGPGDFVGPGDITVSGYAYDKRATSGTGIDRVQIFLGTREEGGLVMSAVVLGQPNPSVPSGSQFSNAGFTSKLSFPDNVNGNRNIVVYAHSSVTGEEAVLTIPVVVVTKNTPNQGTATPTGSPTPLASCSSPSFAAAMATATPVPASGIAAPAAPSTTASGEPVAADGQTLSSQSAQTQTLFRSVWGASAAQEWVTEHNRSLGR